MFFESSIVIPNLGAYNPFTVSILVKFLKNSISFPSISVPLIKIANSSAILLRCTNQYIVSSFNGLEYTNISDSWSTNDIVQLCFRTNSAADYYSIGYRNISQMQTAFNWSTLSKNIILNPSETDQQMLINKGKNSNVRIQKILIYDTVIADSKLISDMTI